MSRKPSKVYADVCAPLTFMGVEPFFIFINVVLMVLAIFIFKTKAIFFLPVVFILHKLLQSVSKDDPYMRHVYTSYHFQADRYEPWPESDPKRGLRPVDLGRGVVG